MSLRIVYGGASPAIATIPGDRCVQKHATALLESEAIVRRATPTEGETLTRAG